MSPQNLTTMFNFNTPAAKRAYLGLASPGRMLGAPPAVQNILPELRPDPGTNASDNPVQKRSPKTPEFIADHDILLVHRAYLLRPNVTARSRAVRE